MLSGTMIAAQTPELEYVQIVSFGCGHDAILSDEITRILQETAQKSPLILKVDEGDAANSLHIRVKSFLETVTDRRAKEARTAAVPLGDAYPAKFQKADRNIRTVLVPNVSAAFCKLLSAVLHMQQLCMNKFRWGHGLRICCRRWEGKSLLYHRPGAVRGWDKRIIPALDHSPRN